MPGKRVPAVFRIKTTRLFSKHRTGEGEKERCEIKELGWLTLTCGSSRALTQFCHGCFASVSGLRVPSRSTTFWFPLPWLHTRRLTVSSSSPPPWVRSQHYLKLPVQFKPSAAGTHAGSLLIQSESGGSLVIQLTGEALP